MPSFQYRSTPWTFRPIEFDGLALLQVGTVAESAIKARLALGRNVNDQPAPPLSPDYARAKVRRGKSASRDWNLSGETIAAMTVALNGSKSVAVSFGPLANTRKLAVLAAHNVGYRQMMGLSPSDEAKIETELQAQVSEKVAENNA